MTEKSFTEKVVDVIKRIPRGKVATYGLIATMAGNRHAARQVVWVLNSLSQKHDLPWHRVINSRATISLTGEGYRLQRNLLEAEGVIFDEKDKVDFDKFLWKPNA
jgi:methylated-DNA-protein-cysteine methyltransferase-like protein